MVKNLGKFFSLFTSLMFAVYSVNGHALDSSLLLHKVDQQDSHGYSLSLAGELFNQRAFSWQVNYNRLENVAIEGLDNTSEIWDEAEFDFSIQTVDLMLGYRFYPKSYNKFVNSLMFETQLGASVNLTDHKFVFRPNFDRDDIYFAEKADINAVASMALHKSFTKTTSMVFGIKYYPSYSDFGDLGTVYLGFNYRFGRQKAFDVTF